MAHPHLQCYQIRCKETWISLSSQGILLSKSTSYSLQIPDTTLEYSSHIWGGAPTTTLKLLDSIQRRAIRLIGDPSLTNSLQPLSHRHAVADLYLLYRYYNGRCSTELTSIIPPTLSNLRPTRHNLKHHPHYLDLPTSYHSSSFIPRACQLWNSLPPTVFPSSYNLQFFKTKTNDFLLARLITLHSQ